MTNGVYKPLLVRRRTGEILAGNNVFTEAVKLGIREFDVVYKDVDEDMARRIVLVDNRSSDGGGYDEVLLREMLTGMPDWLGTGYTDEEAAEIIRRTAAGEEFDGEADGDWDEPLILEDVATGAAWAELPQQEAARAERQAAQKVSAVKGTREIMLVYTAEEHEEMIRLLDGLRGRVAGEVRYPQIIRRLVLAAAAADGML